MRSACRGFAQYSKRAAGWAGAVAPAVEVAQPGRSSKRRRTHAVLPMGTPSATKPWSAGSAAPHHASGPSSSMPGGGGPPAARYARVLPRLAVTPWGRDEVEVVQKRCQNLVPRARHRAVPKQCRGFHHTQVEMPPYQAHIRRRRRGDLTESRQPLQR